MRRARCSGRITAHVVGVGSPNRKADQRAPFRLIESNSTERKFQRAPGFAIVMR